MYGCLTLSPQAFGGVQSLSNDAEEAQASVSGTPVPPPTSRGLRPLRTSKAALAHSEFGEGLALSEGRKTLHHVDKQPRRGVSAALPRKCAGQ